MNAGVKRFFLFLFLIFLSKFSWAQTYIGIKMGYSPLSIISFKPDSKATLFLGERPDYGFVLKYYDNKWVGFQGEMNFTQRGFNRPYRSTIDTAQLRQVNNYVELPMFMQLHINLAGVYLHVNAGCYAAYLISSKQGVDTTGRMVLKNYHFNILRDNRFDYGLIGGAGLSHEFSWGVIQVEARVSYGFADLYKYTYSGMPEQSKAVVQNVSISYMYNFSKLSKKRFQKLKDLNK
jgi:hypothetical protein